MKQNDDYSYEQLEEFDAKLAGKVLPIKVVPEKKKKTFFKRNKKLIYKVIMWSTLVDWVVLLPIMIVVIKHILIFTFCHLTGLVDVATFTGSERKYQMNVAMFLSVMSSIGIYVWVAVMIATDMSDKLWRMK